MSGLLVKSTVVMRDNLAELNSRGLARTWPVLLGGAALTRAYVEQDLAALFDGEVRYARDAFEGLRLMDAFMAVKRGDAGAQLPPLREARVKPGARLRLTEPAAMPARSDVATDNEVPVPPFYGDRIVKGIALSDYAAFLDERATFLGQWGLKPARGGSGPSYEELVEAEGRPRLRMWLDRIQAEGLVEAAVVYGYFRAASEGDDLVVLDDSGAERERFTFPRQRHDRHLCLADFFRPAASGEPDVVGFQLVTVGTKLSRRPPSCSPRTPTGTTWSCTGCPSSSPRRSRSTGTAGCATSSAWPPLTRPVLTASSRSATAAAATRSATRPARTWTTGRRWSGCCARSGSGWCCRRSSSSSPSSPPTR